MHSESLGRDQGFKSVALPILDLTNQHLGENELCAICLEKPSKGLRSFSSRRAWFPAN